MKIGISLSVTAPPQGGPFAPEGVERVVNGTFDTDASSWTLENTPTVSVTSGVVSVQKVGGTGSIWQDVPVSPGSPHVLNLGSIASGFLYLYDAAGFTSLFSGMPKSAAVTSYTFTPSGPTVRARLFVNNTTGTFDNVSIQRLIRGSANLPWADAAWAALGDSLTAQNQWQPYVAAETVARQTNLGVGGTRVSGTAADAMWQDARVNTISTGAEIVTLLGGTNDWVQAAALGTVGSTDTGTFYGALATAVRKIAARAPGAVIVLVTPPYSQMLDYASRGWANSTTNTIGLTIADYAAAMVAWGAANGYPVADVYTSSGITASNITDNMTNDGNLIHPNATGGRKIGAVVTSKLTATSAPTNRLTNSKWTGAASGTPGTTPTSWSRVNTGTGSSTVSTGVLGGNKVRFVCDASSRLLFAQTQSVAAGQTYVWSAQVENAIEAAVQNFVRAASGPAGSSVSYRVDGVAQADTYRVPVGLHIIEAVVTIGATAGTVGCWAGAGTASTDAGGFDVTIDAPQFELASARRGYTPT